MCVLERSEHLMSGTNSSLRVGVIGGTRLPGNVKTFLRNVRDLLEPHPVDFEFDLLLREASTVGLSGFQPVDTGIEGTSRAIRTLQTLTTATTKYARSRPIDVLFQVTKFPLHGFAATVAGKRTDTPVITRFAGDNFREHVLSDGVGERTRTFALNNIVGYVPTKFSDATIVLGPHGKSEIRQRNGSQTIHEIPQPVDFDRFDPVSDRERATLRNELGIEDETRVVLTVGRLSERKGMADLIDAANSLADRTIDLRWYVAGDGPFREKLLATPLVEPIGRIPHEQMPDYYRVADVVVHPSHIEGLPNVLLEAAACGTPTVSRRVGDAETVASKTYTDTSQLPDLMLENHEAAELGERFAADTLRKAYAKALVATATNSRP